MGFIYIYMLESVFIKCYLYDGCSHTLDIYGTAVGKQSWKAIHQKVHFYSIMLYLQTSATCHITHYTSHCWSQTCIHEALAHPMVKKIQIFQNQKIILAKPSQVDSKKVILLLLPDLFSFTFFLTSSWEPSKNVKPQCPRAFECTTVPVKLAFLLLRELLSWVSQQIYQEQDSADEQTELQSTLNGGLWWNRKSLHIQL